MLALGAVRLGALEPVNFYRNRDRWVCGVGVIACLGRTWEYIRLVCVSAPQLLQPAAVTPT